MNRRAGEIHARHFGAGPDVVMVHGWGMHGGVWRDFAMRLAEHFRITLVDLPGHGRSGLIPGQSLEDWGDALLGMAPARAHWLGWSLGGLIALQLAHRHPTRVASLTMLAGNVRFAQGSDWPHAMAQDMLEKFAGDMLADAHHTLLRFLGLQVWGLEQAKDLMKELRGRVEECAPPEPDALRVGLNLLRGTDLRATLAQLRVPLLLLIGGRDRLVPRTAGRSMAEMAPRAQIHEIAMAGHVPFLTHEAECVRVLEDFWGRHEPGA
ncbi:pimeloyl-ACP methyl ester esterase BioH [Methyloterricola oryzae]|uniref:pimeloyl-ACP methyl ester esterase BioH n=1 Tax=Methyloterricola oryzae TaxID=1495050 RepID=UPI0005EBD219|nr:pimeloyl-ACP methyl ester esterase BioH [Methyloterricola oryzae]